MISVLLVDDHALIRAGIRQFLEKDSEIVVIGEAADGLVAQAFIQRNDPQPDVVLLDIKMAHMSGIELTRWLKEAYPDIYVLILTAFADTPYISAVMAAGADGYVLKTASPTQLIQFVKRVSSGEIVIEGALAEAYNKIQKTTASTQEALLTDRENTVLQVAINGATNKQIAEKLGLSSRTIQTHFANIFRKLDVNTRTQAVAKAIQLGIIAHE